MLLDNWNAAKAREHEHLMKMAKRNEKKKDEAKTEDKPKPELRQRFDEPTAASKARENAKATRARLARAKAGPDPPQLRKPARSHSADMGTTRTSSGSTRTSNGGTRTSTGAARASTGATRTSIGAARTSTGAARTSTGGARTSAGELGRAKPSTASKRTSGGKRVSGGTGKATAPKTDKVTASATRSSPAGTSRVAAARAAAPRVKRPASARGALASTGESPPGPKLSKRSSTGSTKVKSKSPQASTSPSNTTTASHSGHSNLLAMDDTPPRLHPFLDRDQVESRREELAQERQAHRSERRGSLSADALTTGTKSIRRSLSGSSMRSTASRSSSTDSEPRQRSGSFRRDSTPDVFAAYRDHPFISTDHGGEVITRPRSNTHSGDLTSPIPRARRASSDTTAATRELAGGDTVASSLIERSVSVGTESSGSGVGGAGAPRHSRPIVVSRLEEKSASDGAPVKRKAKISGPKKNLARPVHKDQRADMRSWRGGDRQKQLAEQKREETRQRVALEREIRQREENEALDELVQMAENEQQTALSKLEEKWRKEDEERLAKKEQERKDREVQAVKDAKFFEQRRLERRATLKVHRSAGDDDEEEDEDCLPEIPVDVDITA